MGTRGAPLEFHPRLHSALPGITNGVDMAVKYADGVTDVQLGDRAAVSIWFRLRTGRVVYIPGISPVNPEFEYNGMRWVGIRLEDRSLVATPVLAKTETLKRKVKFIERDGSPCELITASSREFERDGEGIGPF